MKFETTSVNIVYFIRLKYINLAWTLNSTFSLLFDFVISLVTWKVLVY